MKKHCLFLIGFASVLLTGVVLRGQTNVSPVPVGFGGFGPFKPVPPPAGSVAPAITAQPASASVATGAAAVFSVAATGTPAPTFQWSFNGRSIYGATASSYTLTPAAIGSAGVYTVTARNVVGSITSAPATLSVAARPIVTSAPKSQTINAGANLTLAVAATGSGLKYQWAFNGRNIASATASSLAIANANAGDAGEYSVSVTDGIGVAAVDVAELAVTVNAWIKNLSSLKGADPTSVVGTVGPGNEQLTVGFQIAGTGTKAILVRGIGPTLATFGVGNPLAAPVLTLTGPNGPMTIATNLAWGGTAPLTAAFTSVGAFALPAGSKDTALLETLAPGGYTASITGANNSTGAAMAEVFDADTGTLTATLVNISARAYVSASNVLTAGFVIAGTTSDTVLIRGVGPTLAGFGVRGVLSATTVTLHNSSGTVINADTGWNNDSGISGAATQCGAFPLNANSGDSALLVTIPPGAYTVQVAGASGPTGQGMVEIYEVK